jgi:hypothetical protein
MNIILYSFVHHLDLYCVNFYLIIIVHDWILEKICLQNIFPFIKYSTEN